jgi:hypothetical protein
MWNPFLPKPVACPIDADQRRWLDARFAWLGDQFGRETPRGVTVVLPTEAYFPDRYEGRPEDARPMFDRVARYMSVDPARFELFLYQDGAAPGQGVGYHTTSGAAGVYMHDPSAVGQGEASRRVRIGLEVRQLADPVSLVATLAHEIGHDLLLGSGRLAATEPDHEPVTDLLTVFLGLGVFTANATVRDRGWHQGNWAGWQTSRHGYLDQRMLGYALAKFAQARGEDRPPWEAHVRPDVRVVMRQALRHLADAGAT